MTEYVWEVQMFKNVGTIKKPEMKWVWCTRIYYTEKTKTDFDLHDVDGLRRYARLVHCYTYPSWANKQIL